MSDFVTIKPLGLIVPKTAILGMQIESAKTSSFEIEEDIDNKIADPQVKSRSGFNLRGVFALRGENYRPFMETSKPEVDEDYEKEEIEEVVDTYTVRVGLSTHETEESIVYSLSEHPIFVEAVSVLDQPAPEQPERGDKAAMKAYRLAKETYDRDVEKANRIRRLAIQYATNVSKYHQMAPMMMDEPSFDSPINDLIPPNLRASINTITAASSTSSTSKIRNDMSALRARNTSIVAWMKNNVFKNVVGEYEVLTGADEDSADILAENFQNLLESIEY